MRLTLNNYILVTVFITWQSSIAIKDMITSEILYEGKCESIPIYLRKSLLESFNFASGEDADTTYIASVYVSKQA